MNDSPKIKISGAGVMSIHSADLFKSSKFLNQVEALGKMYKKENEMSDKNIRNLILNDIDEMREKDFEPDTMRWSHWWFKKDEGLIYIGSKKDRSRNQPMIRLYESNIADFAALDDDKLLTTYKLLIRIKMKQM